MQKNCKKVAKKLQKNCKKIAKKLQKSCKMRKRNFLLCKIFAKFLQILNLHTDFRPREESVKFTFSHLGFENAEIIKLGTEVV